MKSQKIKPQCSTCKFADKRNGVGSWSCASPSAYRGAAKLPPNFPRVFSNDSCANWVAEVPAVPPKTDDAAAPTEA